MNFFAKLQVCLHVAVEVEDRSKTKTKADLCQSIYMAQSITSQTN